jgi:PAS domain S-box-containing protein
MTLDLEKSKTQLLEDLKSIRCRCVELEEAEANINAIIENTVNMKIVYFDRKGSLMKFNKAYSETVKDLYGVEVKKGMRLSELLPKDQRIWWKRHAQRALKGEHFLEEFVMERGNGEKQHWEISFNPILRDGEVKGYAEFAYDITYRKKAEKALKESEEKFRSLSAQLPVGVYRTTVNGKILYANQKLASILGYENVDELQHSSAIDFYVDFNDRKKQIEMWRQKNSISSSELRLKTKKGNIIWVRDTGKLVKDNANNTNYLDGIIEDITSNKEAEAALKESEKKYRTLTENLGVGVFRSTVGPKGKFIEVNPAMVSIFGYDSKEELYRINASDLYQNPADRILFNEKMYKTEFIKNEELIAKKKNGTIFVASETSVAIKNPKGEIIYFDGIVEDITERKKLQQELIKHKKLESVGILAGGIAHDFNNLLTAIIGNISMVKATFKPEDKYFRMLNSAEKATVQAADLTRKLITFSKGGWLNRKRSPLSKVIRLAMSKLDGLDQITFNIDLPVDLHEVNGDEDYLVQVFYNLFQNAWEAMNTKKIIAINAENIYISSEDKVPLPNGEYVKVKVIDEGRGISKEHLGYVFDPYFTTKGLGAQKGMGLGLSICHSIINKHDGHISVESEVGRGTVISLYLPVFKKEISFNQKKRKLSASVVKKILLMDDEPYVIEVGCSMLEQLGYEVDCFIEGAEAIENYKKNQEHGELYNLVILDIINKKGLGGIETLKKLLKFDPGVKAIAISGYLNDSELSDLKNAGFCEVMSKPFNINKLKEVIAKAVI